MKAHILLAHPEPKSFNAQLSEISRDVLSGKGFACTRSDLHAMNFDPLEDARHYTVRKDPEKFHPQTEQRHSADNQATPPEISAEMEHLAACDLLVVHFPLWWFGMPAIMKGWMDRVFVYGPVYSSTKRYDAGVFRGKRMIACMTTGAPAEACSPSGREGDARLLMWPLLYPFRYIGFDVLKPEIMHGVGGTTFLEGREKGLSTLDTYKEHWREALAKLDSRDMLNYNPDTDYDESNRLLPGAPVHSPFISHPVKE